jgi:hypothetical protein
MDAGSPGGAPKRGSSGRCLVSRRSFELTHERLGQLEVIGGWDRPLGYSFPVVLVNGADDENAVVYSNLDDPDGPDVPPDKARDILESFGLPIPTGFIEALGRDRAERPGNLDAQYLTYAGDGRPQFEVWLRRDGPGQSPYLEETHEVVYTCFEPLGTSLEAGAKALFDRLSNPRSGLLASQRLRAMQPGDVVRVQRGDGNLEWLERSSDGWRRGLSGV